MNAAIELITRHRVAAVLLFLLVFPWIMPYDALAVNILIFGLFAVGFNLLFGYTGLLVGVVFALTSLFAPELAELSIFVLMAVVLLVRPQGLFGKAGLMG